MVVDNPLIPGLEYGWKHDDVSGRSGIPNKKAVDVRVLWFVFWKVSGLWLPTQHDWEPGKTPEGSCVKCTPPEFWRIDTQNNLKGNDICHTIFGIYSWNFGGVPALWFPGEMANGKAFSLQKSAWSNVIQAVLPMSRRIKEASWYCTLPEINMFAPENGGFPTGSLEILEIPIGNHHF